MKKMTCKDMGGSCNFKMTANTTEEMIAQGMAHVKMSHPEIVEQMSKMTPEENEKWNNDFKTKWETTPEEQMGIPKEKPTEGQ